MNPQEKAQMEMMKQTLESLQAEFYKNNFSGSQDFTKKVRFQAEVVVQKAGTAPAKCEQGALYVNTGTGKLYVCSATNTWSLVGTQA
jgi:hypothetical protein